jgi:hypothetical protein
LHISSAAAKLNNEMAGLVEKKEDNKEDRTSPLLISSDQVFAEGSTKQALAETDESATITKAK